MAMLRTAPVLERNNAPRAMMRARARQARRRGPLAAPVVTALLDTTRRRPTSAFAAWSERIEAERHRLRKTGTPLSGGRGTTATVAEVTKRASVPPHQAELLFHLVRASEARACLELGTCVGISGAYLAAAMADNGGGRLRSLEGHEDRAEVARDTWRRLGLADAEVVVGRFERTVTEVLDGPPFDLVFIDGDHDGDATRGYVDQVRAVSRPGAILVLDDVAWSAGMRASWEQIQHDLHESVCVDLERLGIVVLGPHDAGI